MLITRFLLRSNELLVVYFGIWMWMTEYARKLQKEVILKVVDG